MIILSTFLLPHVSTQKHSEALGRPKKLLYIYWVPRFQFWNLPFFLQALALFPLPPLWLFLVWKAREKRAQVLSGTKKELRVPGVGEKVACGWVSDDCNVCWVEVYIYFNKKKYHPKCWCYGPDKPNKPGGHFKKGPIGPNSFRWIIAVFVTKRSGCATSQAGRGAISSGGGPSWGKYSGWWYRKKALRFFPAFFTLNFRVFHDFGGKRNLFFEFEILFNLFSCLYKKPARFSSPLEWKKKVVFVVTRTH